MSVETLKPIFQSILSYTPSIVYAAIALLWIIGILNLFRSIKRYILPGTDKIASTIERAIQDIETQAKQGIKYPASMVKDSIERSIDQSYERYYLNHITSLANLLPPLGFVGTICGMITFFNNGGNATNDPIGLSIAMQTTFWALAGYIILECPRVFLGNVVRGFIRTSVANNSKRIEEAQSI